MLSETMPGGAALSENKKLCASKSGRRSEGETSIPILRLRQALAACALEGAALGDWAELRVAMREVGEAVGQLSRSHAQSPLLGEARTLLISAIESGGHEIGVDAQDVTMAQTGLDKGWPGLISAMFFAPAWELSGVPSLGEVPDWLWGDYTAWLFAVPRNSSGHNVAARYAAHILPHLEELNRWLSRNSGSATVRAAVESYLKSTGGYAWHGAGACERRHADLRGQILSRFLGRVGDPFITLMFSREGRALRVGFVGRDFGPTPDTYAAFASFEKLDPQGFEVSLFSFRDSDTHEAESCRQRAISHEVLPAELENQIRKLRDASLDIVVFCTDVGNCLDEVTRLALHRVADLQVVNQRNGLTAGLPEIDLYLSGALSTASDNTNRFSERIGLLRGPSHVFSYPQIGEDSTAVVSRESLGLPASASLLATLVSPSGVSAETLEAWAAVLAAAPGSRLLIGLFFRENGSVNTPAFFCARLEAVFARHGVATDRVSVFPITSDSAEEPRMLLRVADLYLDSISCIDPARVGEALAVGLPALVVKQAAGDRDASAFLLRSVDLPELVAQDAAGYVRQAIALATDTAAQDKLKNRLKNALGADPVIFDSLANADSFGALLETAFDELVTVQHAEFRAAQSPLVCAATDDLDRVLASGFAAHVSGDFTTEALEANIALRSDPVHPKARHLRGLSHVTLGNSSRAVDYLMAALKSFSDDANYWFTLASALRQNQQIPQAIQALETSLRLDEKQLEPWVMLMELAEQAGSLDLAREAYAVAKQIAPDDYRLGSFALSLG